MSTARLCDHTGSCYEADQRRADAGHGMTLVPRPKMDTPELVAAVCACGDYTSGPSSEPGARQSWRDHADAKIRMRAERTCAVTGRVHLTAAELAVELGRIRSQLAVMRVVEAVYDTLTQGNLTAGLPPEVGAAWNAAHDAVAALEALRAEVAANPVPIPPAEAGTYELVKQNID